MVKKQRDVLSVYDNLYMNSLLDEDDVNRYCVQMMCCIDTVERWFGCSYTSGVPLHPFKRFLKLFLCIPQMLS